MRQKSNKFLSWNGAANPVEIRAKILEVEATEAFQDYWLITSMLQTRINLSGGYLPVTARLVAHSPLNTLRKSSFYCSVSGFWNLGLQRAHLRTRFSLSLFFFCFLKLLLISCEENALHLNNKKNYFNVGRI